MAHDMFDDLLNLEDNYYQEGYRLGVEDGTRAGRIEGRTFGLEQGFKKFYDMGRLHGQAIILQGRIRTSDGSSRQADRQLKPLTANDRLDKHVRTFFALTELESLSTENTEEAVSEFDDRLKRALAKTKVIDNVTGERSSDEDPAPGGSAPEQKRAGVKLSRAMASADRNIEDFGIARSR